MSNSKERRSGHDRRQASSVTYFPILDSNGHFIESDRRGGGDLRAGPRTTLQFINAREFLASLADLES